MFAIATYLSDCLLYLFVAQVHLIDVVTTISRTRPRHRHTNSAQDPRRDDLDTSNGTPIPKLGNMKRPEVSDIVYARQWPKAKQNDPQNWLSHVQRNLVTEVRIEVQTFYGALDSLEAQYPGLNYTYEPHRRRLARFQWHRRLFRIFDELNLTSEEILSICVWEGTKSAKDKYEQETGRKIKDTTSDGIVYATRTTPVSVLHGNIDVRKSSTVTVGHINHDVHLSDVDQSEDELQASVGMQLNEQLMRGTEDELLQEGPLEEWLKYMNDREVDRDSMLHAIRAGHPPPTVYERRPDGTATFPRPDLSQNIVTVNGFTPAEAVLQSYESRVQA